MARHKQALEDSVRSFNSEYGGSAESKSINGHRFRIFYVYEEQSGRTLLSHRVEIDIDFDKNARKVKAESPSNYSTVQRYLPLTFAICADHASAYLCDKDDRRIIADEFARLVLEPLFFPKR